MYLESKLYAAEPQVKPVDHFTLDALAAWLATKSADEMYCYFNTGECLIAQYFIHAGVEFGSIGGSQYWVPASGKSPRRTAPLPCGFNAVSVGYPRTFGGALERARALIAKQEAVS